MKKGANSNIYEFTAENILETYGTFIEGTPGCLVILLSSDPIDAASRDALQKSMERLGFQENSRAWVTLTINGISLGENEVRTVIEGLDPVVLAALDAKSIAVLEKAYRCAIVPNAASRVFGRTTAAFENFGALLNSPNDKQRAWAILKELREQKTC